MLAKICELKCLPDLEEMMESRWKSSNAHIVLLLSPSRRIISGSKSYVVLSESFFKLQSMNSDARIRKPVLDDLRPYVCTYSGCEFFDHFFENRDQWYMHEASHHRVKLFCNTAKHPDYEAQLDFLMHMKKHHEWDFSLGQRSLLNDMFRHPSRSNEGQCNLCMRTSSNLRSHVSRHLQQISLFALPRVNETAGSEKAELNTQSSEDDKSLKKQRQAAEQSSNSSHSTLDAEDIPGTFPETPEAAVLPEPPDLSEDVEAVGVPDADDPQWDKITTKFSEAREDISKIPPLVNRGYYIERDQRRT
jgi:hypothetical protein